MKKLCLILFGLLLLCSINVKVKAENACNKNTAEQLSKIIYKEVGFADVVAADNKSDMFLKLTTGGIVLNNASEKKGNSWYQKLLNLTDGQYAEYSTYRDLPLEEVVPYKKKRGEMLYISALVLTGKYNLPKNMYNQSSCACMLGTKACQGIDVGKTNCTAEVVDNVVWTSVKTLDGYYDAYFGYRKVDGQLTKEDLFGNTISDTSPDYYKRLALSLELEDYSMYNDSNTVCNLVSKISGNGNDNNTDDNSDIYAANKKHKKLYVDVPTCENPDILKVIYFASIIINIVKIIVPIGLIVLATIEFSKGITSNSDSDSKKNLSKLIKRFIYAVLIFAVPWIVKVLIVNLGNLTDGVNYTDCIENANSEDIARLEADYEELLKKAEEEG